LMTFIDPGTFKWAFALDLVLYQLNHSHYSSSFCTHIFTIFSL
jgi:hypothetical protein